MLQEGVHPVANQVSSGLMSGKEKSDALGIEFFFREHFSFFLDVDEETDEICPFVPPAFCNGLLKERSEFNESVLRRVGLFNGAIRTAAKNCNRPGPMGESFMLRLRYAQHLGDDAD